MNPDFIRGARTRLAMTAFAVFSVSAPAQADPAPPFAALFQQALSATPRLAESAANIRAAEGLAMQAGVRPNPILGLEVENIGTSKGYSGLSGTQTTLSIGQPFELGGKRQARIEAGSAGVVAAQARSRQLVVDFGYELATAYAAAEAAQSRTTLFEEALIGAREDLRAAQALVNAGREADLRSVQAQAAVAAAEAEVAGARATAQTAFAQLANLAGVVLPFTGVDASLLPQATNPPPLPPAFPENTPAVATAQAERDAAARRIVVEQSRATPDITGSLGVRRIAGDNATVFVGAISVPLPLFDKNQGNIAAALAQRDAADARLTAARIEAENSYRAAVAQAMAADARLHASMQAETAAAEAARLARVGYDAGRTPLIELLTARRNLTVVQGAMLDARVARINAEATLARLFGRIPFGGTP